MDHIFIRIKNISVGNFKIALLDVGLTDNCALGLIFVSKSNQLFNGNDYEFREPVTDVFAKYSIWILSNHISLSIIRVREKIIKTFMIDKERILLDNKTSVTR